MIAENLNGHQGDGCEDPTELLTAGDLAKKLRVSLRQVRRLHTSGLVPAPLKIGGCLRWREGEISEWLKAGAPVRSEWELKRDVELVPTVENP